MPEKEILGNQLKSRKLKSKNLNYFQRYISVHLFFISPIKVDNQTSRVAFEYMNIVGPRLDKDDKDEKIIKAVKIPPAIFSLSTC